MPWYQGIEFNSAMRRLGKEAYMFNYNGEPHGLRNRDNMKHWTVHMDEFFDHYLLGKPRPEWMDKGVSFLERGTRDVDADVQAEGCDCADGAAGQVVLTLPGFGARGSGFETCLSRPTGSDRKVLRIPIPNSEPR